MEKGKAPKIHAELDKRSGTGGKSKASESGRYGYFYPDIRAFLDAVLLGEEGDLKRCGGKIFQEMRYP